MKLFLILIAISLIAACKTTESTPSDMAGKRLTVDRNY